MPRTRLLALAAGLVLAGCASLVVAGCASQSTSSTPPPSGPTPPLVASPSAGLSVPRSSPVTAAGDDPLAAAVAAVVREAANQLGVDQSQVSVVQAEARQWPDRSLGCPKPGVMYAQIVTPGYLVVVTGAGKRLEYHTDQAGQSVLCQQA